MNNDPLLMNKIAGAILSATLLAIVTGFIAHLIYQPETLAKPAYAIAAAVPAPAAAAAKAPAGPEPVGGLLAGADAAAGKSGAKKCVACHSFKKGGPKKVGPNLWNMVGAKQAGVSGYKYSGAFKGLAGSWSYAELNKFLFKPKAYVKGTKMSFAGLKKAKDRANMIAYLRSLSDNPKPLP